MPPKNKTAERWKTQEFSQFSVSYSWDSVTEAKNSRMNPNVPKTTLDSYYVPNTSLTPPHPWTS
jgi:hypothetical protein